jgi:two-component system sensor histidine kinase ChvG
VRRRHSVRTLIYIAALTLVILPLGFVFVAYVYEQSLVREQRSRLAAIAAEIVAGKPIAALARRERIEARILDQSGAIELDSETEERTLPSGLDGEHLADLERAFGPLASRDEVQRALTGETAFVSRTSPSTRTILLALAVPRPGGGVIYLEKGSHQGMRQLIVMRSELLKLTAYQLLFAVVFAALLGRWLASPLARLARAARRYPTVALADRRLLDRRDEIGDLARAFTSLARDLEERRRQAAELGADVAHEFKNPLATIAASAELIATTRQDTPEKRALVASHIGEAVERLRRSIDSLLSLLRLEVSLADEQRERIDYRAFLETLLDEYRRDPRWSAVTLGTDVAEDARSIVVIPTRWAELMRNLVDNALIQPSDRREVAITIVRAGDCVITRVRDFGPGVSPGNRENIFRRFYSQRPAGALPGTGLGLSIVQSIAAAHGGTVKLEPPIDQGACFVVTLPDS